jgi:mono/diheme cytochrome c family protein
VVTRKVLLGLGLAALAPLLMAGSPDVVAESIDVAKLPPKYQESYKVFAVRCSKCHSLSRALNGRLTPDGWRNYVRKMSRTAGSGINPSNGAVLVDFLIYFNNGAEAPDGGSR